MRQSIRVALPGYNVETDTNPDHFALYSDQDWILIKEFNRGSISVSSGGTETITHNLGYIPFFAVYAEDGSFGKYINGYNIYSDQKCYATTSTLVLINNGVSSITFKYYIFYDRQI